jgi:hypothetical protein
VNTLQGELDNLNSHRGDASSSTDAPALLMPPSDPLN